MFVAHPAQSYSIAQKQCHPIQPCHSVAQKQCKSVWVWRGWFVGVGFHPAATPPNFGGMGGIFPFSHYGKIANSQLNYYTIYLTKLLYYLLDPFALLFT